MAAKSNAATALKEAATSVTGELTRCLRKSSPTEFAPDRVPADVSELVGFTAKRPMTLRTQTASSSGEEFLATGDHPFYVRGKGWVKTRDLKPGDKLRTAEGKWVTVEGVRGTGLIEPVYNLRIENAHTYFVVAPNGGPSVLVHNESPATQPTEANDERWVVPPNFQGARPTDPSKVRYPENPTTAPATNPATVVPVVLEVRPHVISTPANQPIIIAVYALKVDSTGKKVVDSDGNYVPVEVPLEIQDNIYNYGVSVSWRPYTPTPGGKIWEMSKTLGGPNSQAAEFTIYPNPNATTQKSVVGLV